MTSKYILAIESSCDETSMAIVKDGKEDLGTVILSQIDIHKNYGGVVPEIASRNHIENITIVLDELLTKTNIKIEEIDEAIRFGINHNITIKIQPTLWEFNQEDYREIIEHYLKIGIKWFTFHAGSFEALWKRNIIVQK